MAAIRPEAIEAEICKRSFYEFFIRAWPELEKSDPFREGLHIRIICDALQAVAEGRCRRLIINIPPRHTKSKLASVAFPAWLWIRKPTTRVIDASHSEELALELSGFCRDLLESAWFIKRWPECQLKRGKKNVTVYGNVSGGTRRALSAESMTTGFTGDILIGDDVQDYKLTVKRKGYLDDTYDWWTGSFMRRLANRETGAIVLVMQRLCEGDLTDRLLSTGKWTHLCLPAEYVPKERDPHAPKWLRHDPRVEAGQPLWGTRESLEELKSEVNEWIWAAQYQQDPLPGGGVILDKNEYRLIERAMLPKFFAYFISWDTAATNDQRNDPTGVTVWGLSRQKGFEGMFLLGTYEEWLQFPQLCKRLPEIHAIWKQPGAVHLIEAAGPTGLSLFQQLRVESQLACIDIDPRPDGGKEERAKLAAMYLYNGLVWIVKDLPDLKKFLSASHRFPSAKKDEPRDVVDSAVQAILYCCRTYNFSSSDAWEELGTTMEVLPDRKKSVLSEPSFDDFDEDDDDDF